MTAHHEDMKRRFPGWKPGDTCDGCGNPPTEKHPVSRRRNGSFTHKTAEDCFAAGSARMAAEKGRLR